MAAYKEKFNQIFGLLQAVFIFIWMSVLKDSDSLVSIYVICSMAAMIALYDRTIHRDQLQHDHDSKWHCAAILSIVYSMLVVLANYPIFMEVRDAAVIDGRKNTIVNMVRCCAVFIGGYFVAMNIISYALQHFPRKCNGCDMARDKQKAVFLSSFAGFLAIYGCYLFLMEYPGNISYDAISQITQAYTNQYIKTHPFWHTMLIKFTMSVGYALFKDVNAAAACFSLCQMLLMAATFAYVITTLYQVGVPKWCLIAIFAMYGFMPYNIVYSVSMHKDVPFSLGVVLLITALYRCIRSIGSGKYQNYFVLALGSLLVCLMRTNGIASLAIILLVMLRFLWKRDRKAVIIIAVIILIGCILYGPVAAAFPQESFEYAFLEPLSVPIQQISRVVVEERDLTGDQINLINQAIDLDMIRGYYRGDVVDDIKITIWRSDSTYLKDNIWQYAKLWLDLGRKYPMDYLKAWIDLTKGYWNGGYNSGPHSEYIYVNDFGLEKAGGIGLLVKLKYLVFGFLRFTVVMEPTKSIGLYVWLLVLCWFINKKKQKSELWLSVPLMVIAAGLIIGAPVSGEFRYIYSLFISMPLIAAVTAYSAETT